MPSIERQEWQRISDHLDHVLELTDPERERYLVDLQGEDPKIASQVRKALEGRGEGRFQQFLAGEALPDADALASATLVGRQVGPYVIDAEIGRGGMGSVWRSRRVDGRYTSTVAIKFVHAAWIGRAGEQRFHREGSLLGRLDHPNIARLLDAGVLDATQPYLVLEYVEGEPIDAFCERRQLTLEQRITLFLDVLAAVAHAHGHLIVHRDLKPSNVFVTGDGTVKLLDFGIAKLLDDESGSAALTQSSATALTPQYAAPEQLLGQPVTTATDVYALGLVLYVLLTGTHPIDARSRSSAELMRVVLAEDPPRASAVSTIVSIRRKSLEGDLDNILGKALKKVPAERYQSAAAFADDLRRFLTHEPVGARPDTMAYRATKFTRRHRGSVLGGLLIAVGLISTSAFAVFEMSQARRQRDIARAELRRAEAANDFTSLMLEEVGEGGRPMSREQLLDRGVELLDARYGGDREFVADMLSQLAGRYGDDERNDMAIALTKRSIDISRQAGQPSLLALTLCEGAHQEVQGDTHPDVDNWLSEANGLMSRLSEVPLRLKVTCLIADAERASNAGEWDRATASLKQAHALQLAEGVNTGLQYTSVLNDLGAIYFQQGHFPEAYAFTIEIGEAFDRGGRGGTTGRKTIHQNAAVSLVRMGEARAALAELEAGHIAISGPQSGSEVPLGSQPVVALVLRRLGRLQDARVMIAGVADRALAADNPTIASNALIQEGAILAELNEPGPARQRLEHAIEMMSPNAKGRAGALAQAQGLLADLEVRSGQAESARRRVEAFLKSAGYPKVRETLTSEPVLVSAARTMLALGDVAAAESYANDALAIAERSARTLNSSADVGDVLMIMAQLRMSSRRPEQARPLLERALECFSNGLGPEAPLTDGARQTLRSTPAA